MKKMIVVAFLAFALSASALLSGCSSENTQKAQEYKELGITQMEGGDYEAALISFQNGLDQSLGKIGAQEVDLCYYKALAQFKTGDIEGAIDTYTALVDFDDDNWEVYYLRGNARLQNGQEKKCLQDYKKAVSLNREDYQLYVNIYETLAAAGYEDEGLSYLKKAMKLEPSKAEDYTSVGYIYFLQEDYESAEKNLQKAVDEGDDKALLYLGQVLSAGGKNDDAKDCFEKYVKKYPNDAEAVNEMGEIALNTKQYEEAVSRFRQAIEMDEEKSQPVRRNLIAAFEESGDFEQALQEAKDYLEDYPKDEAVQREYMFLKTRVKE